MNHNLTGNLLLVSNYPSDTAYAWWLMEHFWKTLAEQFTRAGHKAYLAYPKITSLSETIQTSPIEAVELVIPWDTSEQETHVQKFLKNNNISTIYFTDQPYFHSQYFKMRLSGVQNIIVHDHTPGDRPPIRGLKGLLKSIKHSIPWYTADKVFCVSELMRYRNITNTRIPAKKCFIVQNGIKPVNCNKVNSTKVRKELGVNPDSILVITTGRAHPYKRFDFIIECAYKFHEKRPNLDVVFLLVGDGPVFSDLQNIVSRMGLENSVRLLGYRNDIHNLLCASDLAFHAALGEGFSLSIIEYMSASLPVLVPDIPSVKQAISHNETGLVYPKNDIPVVIDYIEELAIDKDKRTALGRTAKNIADTVYSLDKCTQSFKKAIKF